MNDKEFIRKWAEDEVEELAGECERLGGSLRQLDVIAGQGGAADPVDCCLDAAILDEGRKQPEMIKTDSQVTF